MAYSSLQKSCAVILTVLILGACQATLTTAPNAENTQQSNASASPEASIRPATAVNQVQVIPDRMVIEAGKSGQANASVRYADNTSDSAVVWSSSDNTIASVDGSTGTIQALKTGEVTIIATSTVDNTKRAAVQMSVKAPGTSTAFIQVTPNSLNMQPRSTATLQATAQLSDGSQSGNLSWSSSDTSVVMVQGNGSQATVTAIKIGAALISVVSDIDSKVSESVSVTVSD